MSLMLDHLWDCDHGDTITRTGFKGLDMSFEVFGDEGEYAADGYVTEDRVDEAFRAGLQAMREMLARFVEVDSPVIAQSMRLNWHPGWGDDPGKPLEVVLSPWD